MGCGCDPMLEPRAAADATRSFGDRWRVDNVTRARVRNARTHEPVDDSDAPRWPRSVLVVRLVSAHATTRRRRSSFVVRLTSFAVVFFVSRLTSVRRADRSRDTAGSPTGGRARVDARSMRHESVFPRHSRFPCRRPRARGARDSPRSRLRRSRARRTRKRAPRASSAASVTSSRCSGTPSCAAPRASSRCPAPQRRAVPLPRLPGRRSPSSRDGRAPIARWSARTHPSRLFP